MRRNPKIRSSGNDSTKMKNRKTEVDGLKFDSKAESRRYLELKELALTHKIEDLRCQVPFILLPSQYLEGKCVERGVKYVADFTYMENGQLIVEDVKSPISITPSYIIKRKMMLNVHGIRIRETMPKPQKRATSV
jgi:hypothetical protein